MTTVTFDYAAQRASILMEMAGRPSALLSSPAGKKMSEYIKTIGGIMKHGGHITDDSGDSIMVPGIPSGKGSSIQNRTYKYILSTITGLLDDDFEDTPELEDDPDFSGGDIEARDSYEPTSKRKRLSLLTQRAMDIIGPSASVGKTPLHWNPIKLYTTAIAKWVNDNPEYATSKEFGDKLTDKHNVLSYISTPTVRSATTTKRGFAKAQKSMDVYGMDVEDYHQLVSQISEPLTKLRKLQFYSSKRKTSTAPITTETTENNIATDNIFIVSYILEDLRAARDTVRRVIESQMDPDKFFEILEYGGSIDDEDERELYTTISRHIVELNTQYFSKKYNMTDSALIGLMTLASNPRYSDFFDETIELFTEFEHGLTVDEIQRELDSHKSFMDKSTHDFLDMIGTSVAKLSQESPDNTYPEFSQPLVDKVFDTPELKSQFDEWYNKIYLAEKRQELAKSEDARDNPGMTPVSGEHGILDRTTQSRASKLAELESKYEKSPYEGDVKSQYKESYVMNYMSSQLSKDRFQPRGEFKDRGFKKPSNYWQGVTKKATTK